MKFFQSSSSGTQLSNFNYATRSHLPRVLHCLPCFRGLDTHHRIKESTQVRCATASPGIVARLMGLESMPQRIGSVNHHEDQRNSNARQSASQTPMVLEIENGKFFFLGFEAGDKCKGDSRSNSKRKLLEDDKSKKKKLIKETSNGLLKEAANAGFDLEFFDQLVLELVYIF